MELNNSNPSPAVSQCQPLEINGSYFIGSENSSLLLPITKKQYAAMTENTMSNEKEKDIKKIICENLEKYANVFSSLAKSEETDKQAAFIKKLHMFGAINSLVDFEIYILPYFLKRRTEYAAQVRRFDIDGCPMFTLCFNNEWIQSDWANYDMFLTENGSNFVLFGTWEQAAKTALEFIETLKA